MENEIKNDYFAKKEIKDQEAKSVDNRKFIKRVIKSVICFVIIIVVAWGVYIVFKNQPNLPKVEAQYFKSQGQEHIAVGASHEPYNSNPPTGGWHYATPAQSGIYDQELPDEQVIHNLEHGHVWIAYRPDLDKDSIEKLAGIAKSYSSKIIMTSRIKNDSPIALVAWEYLLKLDVFDEGKVQSFIQQYRGKGPEMIPDFGFQDFRGKPLPTMYPNMKIDK